MNKQMMDLMNDGMNDSPSAECERSAFEEEAGCSF